MTIEWVYFSGGQVEFEDRTLQSIGPFGIAASCTTVAELAEFCDITGYQTDAELGGSIQTFRDNVQLKLVPLEERGSSTAFCISPRDAETYCRYRGLRIMTEAEWMMASVVIAGEFDVRRRQYPSYCDRFGNAIPGMSPARINYGLEEIVRVNNSMGWAIRSGPLVYRTTDWRRDICVNRKMIGEAAFSIMSSFRVCKP